MMKEVLYLSYDGMTDPLGQSQVLPYLIGLSEKGYRFTLISFEKPERFNKERKAIEAICLQHQIDWRPLTYTKRPPVFSTIHDLRKLKKMAFNILKEKNVQLIHCRSYITMLVGLSLKKRGVKLIFDMRGFWADERIEGGIWNLKNPIFATIYRFFKKKEQQFLNQSDAIISLTHAAKKEILNWKLNQVNETKITVIPCCVDLNLFNPTIINSEIKESYRKNFQLDQQFVVGYVGSIGTWYQLKEMLYTFKQIRKEKSNAIFLFITKEDKRIIWSVAHKLGIKRDVVQIISATHKEVPIYISLFDVSIFYINPTFSKTASSPTKQGELMAMGVPIICNSGVGDTDYVVTTYNAGQIVQSTSFDDLANFQIDISNFNKDQTIKGATEFYGLETGIARYTEIYNQLLQ